MQTVSMKNTFSVSPGASPNGRLATKAMSSVPTTAERAVAVKMDSTGNPFAPSGANIAGISARMYTIVKKVVMPEIISVLRSSRCDENPTSDRSLSFMR
jgi:hypothetical protein